MYGALAEKFHLINGKSRRRSLLSDRFNSLVIFIGMHALGMEQRRREAAGQVIAFRARPPAPPPDADEHPLAA